MQLVTSRHRTQRWSLVQTNAVELLRLCTTAMDRRYSCASPPAFSERSRTSTRTRHSRTADLPPACIGASTSKPTHSATTTNCRVSPARVGRHGTRRQHERFRRSVYPRWSAYALTTGCASAPDAISQSYRFSVGSSCACTARAPGLSFARCPSIIIAANCVLR